MSTPRDSIDSSAAARCSGDRATGFISTPSSTSRVWWCACQLVHRLRRPDTPLAPCLPKRAPPTPRHPGSAGSVHVDPVERPGNRLLPLGVALLALLLAPCGIPATGLVPVVAQLVGGLPEADRESRCVAGTQRGGLGDDRSAHRDAEDVRLDLHAELVGRDAAVHLQHLE